MELKDMRMLSYRDLLEKLREGQKKLFDLKLQLSNQQLKDFMQISTLRKEIARIQTILTEKRVKGEHEVMLAEPEAEATKAKKEKEVKAHKEVLKKEAKEVKKIKKAEKTKDKKTKKEKKRETVGVKK
jgi:large subunit ribosomal protein L29